MPEVPLRDRLIAYALLPLSPARIRLLIQTFDPLSTICHAPRSLLRQLLSIDGADAAEPWRNDELRRQIDALRDSAVTLADDDYPPLLRQLVDPPLALFYRGNLALASKPSIAMVGSRKASPYALNAAAQLARELVSVGFAVVSGMALGVDAAAHQATLDAAGDTIAILGTGIDLVYPPSNRKLFQAIAERGLILTEFPPGTPPFRYNFPVRNRIISGISLGTVIVEANGRSGSLITARTAAEQNREVFAVPGSIFSPGTEGTHRLIQCGVKLVHTTNDILDELPGDLRICSTPPSPPPSPLREVLEVFRRDEGTHIDTAAEMLRCSVAGLSEPVLQLELGGWLKALPGGRYVRVR
ncbi:MAG: processing protein [Thermoanaerobaculia bacterium]|jgi:DNA processing protein|nr:processing protein [Thermoanaerobaculia bacterium]